MLLDMLDAELAGGPPAPVEPPDVVTAGPEPSGSTASVESDVVVDGWVEATTVVVPTTGAPPAPSIPVDVVVPTIASPPPGALGALIDGGETIPVLSSDRGAVAPDVVGGAGGAWMSFAAGGAIESSADGAGGSTAGVDDGSSATTFATATLSNEREETAGVA